VVSKVLHTDERCELYSLISAAGSETILLLVRGPDATPPDVRRLEEWWATQLPQLLTVKQVLRAEECPLNSIASVLALSGRRLEHASLREEPQESLMRLFHAMLDAVDRGLLVQMLPDFSPSLTWLTIDDAAVCSLLPLEGPVPDEREIVRIVARAFYLFATGIAHEQEASEIPALQRWAKFGGEDLSRIVDRCLSTSNSKSCITTLSGLNDAVGRARAEGIESQLPACDHHSTLASSAAGQGLDKVAGMHWPQWMQMWRCTSPLSLSSKAFLSFMDFNSASSRTKTFMHLKYPFLLKRVVFHTTLVMGADKIPQVINCAVG